MFIYPLYSYDYDTKKDIIYQSLMIKWYNLQRGGVLIAKLSDNQTDTLTKGDSEGSSLLI